ncbi:TlyA family RNA methyltransferase [Waterburya agarophytonicola K14]|uniref:TlyA family RNA methyltransferase n=1 Tax=Waterburya agarophytonicola KI4 TaxID=2874699 RepID=A0A964FIW8_9CYAN|nr:TlyA family RNA methyltransferase [Waterburya agarophytonicola]MCC0178769.1 TlyA family RNA methyltransferase [Waterburya agarophytonicola KI4]
MTKQRLDKLLVSLELCDSRALAQGLIRAGKVKVNQEIIDKPGTEVKTTAQIEVKEKPPYVSRGGKKLIQALQTFNIEVEGRICLDGGISTGGFTDCLLQSGAKLVYGVDVGYGQVAWTIRQSDRVILRERTNIRHLTPEDLYSDAPMADLGVMDLSFISLTKVLPTFWNLLTLPKEVVLLVKPQFEVGRDRVGKKGVVRNPEDRASAILQVWHSAKSLGWEYKGLTISPIKGPAGNVEYLLWLSATKSTVPQSLELAQIREIIAD